MCNYKIINKHNKIVCDYNSPNFLLNLTCDLGFLDTKRSKPDVSLTDIKEEDLDMLSLSLLRL